MWLNSVDPRLASGRMERDVDEFEDAKMRAGVVHDAVIDIGCATNTLPEWIVVLRLLLGMIDDGPPLGAGECETMQGLLRAAFRPPNESGGTDTAPEAVEARSGDESEPGRTCGECSHLAEVVPEAGRCDLNRANAITLKSTPGPCPDFEPKGSEPKRKREHFKPKPKSEPERIVAIPATEGFADLRKELEPDRRLRVDDRRRPEPESEPEPERHCGECAKHPNRCTLAGVGHIPGLALSVDAVAPLCFEPDPENES